MLLISHTAMGILSAAVISNPIIAGACAFLSHYVLDIIPHEPENELFYVPVDREKWTDEIRAKLANRKKTSTPDLLFSLILVLGYIYFSGMTGFANIILLSVVVFFSVLPDVFTILYLRYPTRWLSKYYDFHYKIHEIIPLHMSSFTAYTYQIVFATGLVLFALFLV